MFLREWVGRKFLNIISLEELFNLKMEVKNLEALITIVQIHQEIKLIFTKKLNPIMIFIMRNYSSHFNFRDVNLIIKKVNQCNLKIFTEASLILQLSKMIVRKNPMKKIEVGMIYLRKKIIQKIIIQNSLF
jgi:hypothetical protein